MPAVCPVCQASFAEFLHGEVSDEVQERVAELHRREAVKIDHVRRGEAQVCWACGGETKGFHLYKAGDEFIKLCEECARHVATFLAHLVKHEEQERHPDEEEKDEPAEEQEPRVPQTETNS